jgi:GUN4-like/ARM-like repeat domain, GUN4-N terminal
MTNVDIAARPGANFPDADAPNPTDQSNPNRPSDRAAEFRAANEKTQLQLVDQILAAGESAHAVLIDYLQDYYAQGCPVSPIGLVPPVAAKAYHQLYQTGLATDWLKQTFPQGIVPLRSERDVDYQPLQALLVQQSWQAADQLHNLKLCEAAGADALARKWIYFTEVNGLPIADLRTLNALWMAHSDGKFGYSVQREVWLNVGKNYDKLWPKLAWKDENHWTRYPGQFVWNLDAPRGHLPLSNQLRGIQVIKALMNHPAWVA